MGWAFILVLPTICLGAIERIPYRPLGRRNQIGYTVIGSGSVPVVFVHGALNSGEPWLHVAETMSEHCTCYVMGRWGRGGSSYRENYSFEREAEDNSGTFQFQSRHASSSLSKFLAF